MPWDGSDVDPNGFAKWRDNFSLEDNSRPARVLQTHPQWVDEGHIVGEFALPGPIQAGDWFKAEVGFLAGAGGEVEFVMEALVGGSSSSSITRVTVIRDSGGDGQLRTVEIPLTKVYGATPFVW